MSAARLGPRLPALGLDLGLVGGPVTATNLDRDHVVDGGSIHVTCGCEESCLGRGVEEAWCECVWMSA